ncbi:MAG: hypothetical protein BWY64_01613 [bacterium ADurb.Bin363]|nr:MAG: hypothetical protein BWY64_01613 [bacterium ADurb.Bin363]
MLEKLVKEILNEVLGEEEKKDKNTVKKAVKEAIKDIYGEKKFSDQEIYKVVDKYFEKLKNAKEDISKIDYGKNDGISMEELENIMNYDDTEGSYNELDEKINFELDDFEEDFDLLLNEDTTEKTKNEEIDFNEEIDLDDLLVDEKDDDLDDLLVDEKDDDLDDLLVDEKEQEILETPEKKSDTNKVSELTESKIDGKNFYTYISSIQESILSLWEDENDMKEEFAKYKENLEELLHILKVDEEEHKSIEKEIQNKELKELNQKLINMIVLFKSSVEEILKFLDTEDPTYIFSSKKVASQGHNIMEEIGEKLKGVKV